MAFETSSKSQYFSEMSKETPNQSIFKPQKDKKVQNTRIYELKKSVFQDIQNKKFIDLGSDQSTPNHNRSLDVSTDEIINQNNTQQNNHYYAQSNFASHRIIGRSSSEAQSKVFKDTSSILSTLNTTSIQPNFTPFVKERDNLGRLLNINQSLPNINTSINNNNNQSNIFQKEFQNSKQSFSKYLPNIHKKGMSQHREILKRNQKILENKKIKDENDIKSGKKKQKQQINILGEEQNAFKLNSLESDLQKYNENMSQLLNNIDPQKSNRQNNEKQKENELQTIQINRFQYNGNPEESYKVEAGNNKQSNRKIIQRKPDELVSKKMQNQPFIYEINKYCTVLKPRAPEIKILPEHRNEIKKQKSNFNTKSAYKEAKKVTIEILRAQYLAKLPQNPLKGMSIGQNRVNQQIMEAKAQIIKQQELSNKILNYNGEEMLSFEKQLKDLKSIAKKMKNNMAQERENQIKKYNKQAMEEFKEDLERHQENQKSMQKYHF